MASVPSGERRTTHMLDTMKLYDTIDYMRADLGMSWSRLAREVGVSKDIFPHMRDGHSISCDSLVSLLVWAEIEDFRDYIFARADQAHLRDDVYTLGSD